MTSIYRECLDSIIEFGARFTIDLKRRSLKMNGRHIIRDGEYAGDLGIGLSDSFEDELEGLYDRFKHSIPSGDTEYRRGYFKALGNDELDDEDMFFGIPRSQARFELEFFLLSQILLGFDWNGHFGDKWFYQSENDRDLVLIKDWFN